MKRRVLLLSCLLLAAIPLFAFSPPYLTKKVTVFIDGEALEGDTFRVDLSHALRVDRWGGYEATYEKLLGKYTAKEALDYLAIGLGDYLSAACERRKIDPLDATLEWTKDISRPFIYYEAKCGREADLTEVGRAVARAMDKDKGACAYAYTHEVPPAVTEKDMEKRTVEIARFSTDFRTSGESRKRNIALAAGAIHGTVLMPNGSFSFNETVGARTVERGYREANIVVNGAFVKGVGGGVCQVSTTLYNAVLLAALPVENAAAHSLPVSYVPYSRDCTVSSAIDFRFRNDTAHPIYLAAETRGSTLTFVLYGERKEGVRRLESEVVERIPFFAVYKDGARADDLTNAVLVSPGREGVASRLYLVEEKSGAVTRTLIRENLYPAKNAVYKKVA